MAENLNSPLLPKSRDRKTAKVLAYSGKVPRYFDLEEYLHEAVGASTLVSIAFQRLFEFSGKPEGCSETVSCSREDLNTFVYAIYKAEDSARLALRAWEMAFEGTRSSSAKRDPILDAIQNYRAGMADYNASSKTVQLREDEDALISQTYGPPMEVLDKWTAPAMTYEGALEALRLAGQEMHDFENSPITKSLFAAAMAYLEKQTSRPK